MASFRIAEELTGRNEGGYALNKDDRGGETYAGIARKFWPKWAGWDTIDKIKAIHGKSASVINKYAKADRYLPLMISDFYEVNFWDVNKLDQFHNQQIANTVYDFGVNAGVKKGATTLQDVLGVTVDGIIGPKTIAQLNAGNSKAIHTAYNCKRKEYYEMLAKKPGQAKFLESWLSRLKPYT